MRLYEAALDATSTHWAPWYVVPADHKWVSGLAVASLLVDALQTLDPKIPDAPEDLSDIVFD
jgi:polyphosphate kinase 2 (PPK2 family)